MAAMATRMTAKTLGGREMTIIREKDGVLSLYCDPADAHWETPFSKEETDKIVDFLGDDGSER